MFSVVQAPTEYYSLLGLPMFTSDRKEIRAAHRRVVKLVHPDILGALSGDLLVVVTEAYEILSDPDKRKDYDDMLKLAKPTLGTSRWADDAPVDARGIFVDETKCTKCYKCVNIASSTFDTHDTFDAARQEKAFVTLQYGNTEEILIEAVKACPSQAIKFISREDLPLYEYAMSKCSKVRQRMRSLGEEEENLPGPSEILQDFMIDELLAMDMEKALQDSADPLAESRVAEELTQHARTIHAAAAEVPDDVRERLWPDTGVRVATGEAVLNSDRKVGPIRQSSADQVSPGLMRAGLKTSVFRLFDEDEDGFLYESELRKFASKFGFEGTDADWSEEYGMLCSELNCRLGQGIDLRAFSRMVDDEGLCYTPDEDLAAILSETARLPRAGS